MPPCVSFTAPPAPSSRTRAARRRRPATKGLPARTANPRNPMSRRALHRRDDPATPGRRPTRVDRLTISAESRSPTGLAGRLGEGAPVPDAHARSAASGSRPPSRASKRQDNHVDREEHLHDREDPPAPAGAGCVPPRRRTTSRRPREPPARAGPAPARSGAPGGPLRRSTARTWPSRRGARRRGP